MLSDKWCDCKMFNACLLYIQVDKADLYSLGSATANRRWRLISARLSNKFGYCPSWTVSCIGISSTQQLATWADTSLRLLLKTSIYGLWYQYDRWAKYVVSQTVAQWLVHSWQSRHFQHQRSTVWIGNFDSNSFFLLAY